MNEKAEQLIIDAGEKVLAYLEATEEFAVEQAPLLVQEILTRGVFYNWACVICWVLFLPAISMCFVWSLPRGDWDHGDRYVAYTLISGLVGFFGWSGFFLAGLSQLSDALMATFAPRLYIIEQIGGLLG